MFLCDAHASSDTFLLLVTPPIKSGLLDLKDTQWVLVGYVKCKYNYKYNSLGHIKIRSHVHKLVICVLKRKMCAPN